MSAPLGLTLIVVGTVVLAPFAGNAQTPPPTDSTIARISAIGIDGSPLVRLSAQLFDSIGPRLTGLLN